MTCSLGTMRFIVRKSLANPCPTKIAPKFTRSRNFLYAICISHIHRTDLERNQCPLRCSRVEITLHESGVGGQIIHNIFFPLPSSNIIINKRHKNILSPSPQYTHPSQTVSLGPQQFPFPSRCNLRLFILQQDEFSINSDQFL